MQPNRSSTRTDTKSSEKSTSTPMNLNYEGLSRLLDDLEYGKIVRMRMNHNNYPPGYKRIWDKILEDAN